MQTSDCFICFSLPQIDELEELMKLQLSLIQMFVGQKKYDKQHCWILFLKSRLLFFPRLFLPNWIWSPEAANQLVCFLRISLYLLILFPYLWDSTLCASFTYVLNFWLSWSYFFCLLFLWKKNAKIQQQEMFSSLYLCVSSVSVVAHAVLPSVPLLSRNNLFRWDVHTDSLLFWHVWVLCKTLWKKDNTAMFVFF